MNRIAKPADDVRFYCTTDKDNKSQLIDVVDLTKEELQHEVCRAYDILAQVLDAFDDGTLDDLIKARKAVEKFMRIK